MEALKQELLQNKKKWLVTGAAGFIGSHLCEFLLSNNQEVVAVDNFFSGTKFNLTDLQKNLSSAQKANFHFTEGDITDSKLLLELTKGIDIVLHQAAVGSVPRSIVSPEITFHANISGFFNLLNSCRQNHVRKIVFASSSSVYGDNSDSIKNENKIGNALSPYGWSKQTNETLAANFRSVYKMDLTGLRYFNVFGPRQNPDGEYSAVIPRWIKNVYNNKDCEIYGDGLQARDFCYIKNVVEANIKAGLRDFSRSKEWIFNIALAQQTNLLELYKLIIQGLKNEKRETQSQLIFRDRRAGDILNSLADISRAKEGLSYQGAYDIKTGLQETIRWYIHLYQEQKN